MIAVALLARSAIARADVETTLIPIVGGSSDTGWGGGLVGAIARVEPGVTPYVWRLELASMTTMTLGPFHVPFQDDYLVLTVPHLVKDVMRLEVRPSFTYEGFLHYSGLGNASPPPDLSGANEERYFYARLHPSLFAQTRLRLVGPLHLELGARYTYNELDIAPTTVLAEDARAGPPEVRRALVGTDQHSVVEFANGIVFDTRDDEISPTRGQYHLVQVRLAPGGTHDLEYRWGAATAILRGYVSPLGRSLVLAGRIVGDYDFGDVPFYEMSRYLDSYALGGTQGVRGVIAQRYYGRVKLFGNLEARTEVVSFRALAKPMTLGFVGFVDAGRVWFEAKPHPELDGTGLGLKYGIGGGLRLRSGQAFVVRADLAWSPDAFPVSAYFQANQAF